MTAAPIPTSPVSPGWPRPRGNSSRTIPISLASRIPTPTPSPRVSRATARSSSRCRRPSAENVDEGSELLLDVRLHHLDNRRGGPKVRDRRMRARVDALSVWRCVMSEPGCDGAAECDDRNDPLIFLIRSGFAGARLEPCRVLVHCRELPDLQELRTDFR